MSTIVLNSLHGIRFVIISSDIIRSFITYTCTQMRTQTYETHVKWCAWLHICEYLICSPNSVISMDVTESLWMYNVCVDYI